MPLPSSIDDAIVLDGDSVFLAHPMPFSYPETLGYLTRSNEEVLHRVTDDGRILKLLRIKDLPLLVELAHEPDRDGLRIRCLSGSCASERLREAAGYVWDWFGLDADVEAFYRMAARDPVLSPLILRHSGLRIVGVPDLFEALCWSIIGQQITLSFAYQLKKRFVQTYGDSLEYEGERFWSFPDPAVIARLSADDLRPLQFSRNKANFLIGVAREVAAGTLNKAQPELRGGFDAAVVRLTALHGIGPWSANYALMRCLRYPEAFPIQDAGIHQAVRKLLNLDAKPTLAQLRELYAPWAGWEAFATFYLWRSLSD
ncbi:DNA-3-methyladenine glycosylase family protein [Cohnella nanjingensis]|uniref:DNA-3-methyladenine glycosylase II n=1 Tax=Cohnella nanjingensis TaxID=1387779 RepID=A0A7X0VG62_9BACL|nr:DNA-3-methyladenine glycosylase 2 family protein [Cohnella nanjingensis]MBB6672772.1 DNA-3-methyladenine glycosylase 2 family protein [Cohnella nanjingensis]